PADFAPGLVDRIADHRVEDAILMVGIAIGEAALDAAMAAIGLAVLPWDHAHQLLAAHFGAEGAAHAAIGAGGDDGAFRLADFLHALFLERGGGAGLHAGAAAHAFGAEEIVLRLPGADHGGEAAPVDRQRESALHLVTGAHAARTDDAFAGIEIEIGVRRVRRL